MKWINRLIDSVATRGRELLHAEDPSRFDMAYSLQEDCSALLNQRGDAVALAIAQQILDRYIRLTTEEKLSFFQYLARDLSPDYQALGKHAQAMDTQPDAQTYRRLLASLRQGRWTLFELLNIPGVGTQALVRMREDLLDHLADNPELKAVDLDLQTILEAWFNRGFLEFREINWHTPADVLEKLIRYEAVHEIQNWQDLKRRLASDRACFAFFHPALPDEPLIFVQVGYTDAVSTAIDPFLDQDQPEVDADQANTAIFYSISNCQKGLRGISFGNFLIKQVVQHIQQNHPHITQFSTLSPIPGLSRALNSEKLDETRLEQLAGNQLGELKERYQVSSLRDLLQHKADKLSVDHAPTVLFIEKLGLAYLTEIKRESEPYDPVARFHLSNGASIFRINAFANCRPYGLKSSYGLMVNYLYDLGRVEQNHEQFKRDGTIDVHRAMRKKLG